MLAVSLLAFAATRAGRRKKERLGTAEARRGRSAAQVAANLGLAALVASEPVRIWLPIADGFRSAPIPERSCCAMALAALAEAAADTVSSEIGQVLGGRPRMITTCARWSPARMAQSAWRARWPDVVAAVLVAGAGSWAMAATGAFSSSSSAGAVFGLFFDSLLGATLEKKGWLNNDAVNFLSTASASAAALALLAF